MKKNLTENKISESLNSLKPSKNVISQAADYMGNESDGKRYKNKNVIKYSLASLSCVLIAVIAVVLFPIFTKSNGGDPSFIDFDSIYEKEYTAIKDFKPDTFYTYELQSIACSQFCLKSSDDIIYIIEDYKPDEKWSATDIKEIVVMTEYTNKTIAPLENYKYLDNVYSVKDLEIKYSEISFDEYCFSLESDGYLYYIIIKNTNIDDGKKLINIFLNSK